MSLVNILHNTGRLEDGIVVANMALEVSPSLVAIYFSLANIYAAKVSRVMLRIP